MSAIGRFCCRSRRRQVRGAWRERIQVVACHPLPSEAWSGSTATNSALLCKAHLCDRRWSDDEFCEPAEVLRDCRQCELELSTTWSAQAQTTEPKETLEMCKQHLNPFAIATRSLECFGFGHRPCHVTGLLVEASLDSAERSLWAALRLECAATTVACSREIEKGLPIIDQLARRGENLAGRPNESVPPLVEGEV